MYYDTVRTTFVYGGKEWMIQMWKGNYFIANGGEVGLYWREKGQIGSFYNCANDDQMMEMQMKLSIGDKVLINTKPQMHWWLTGFKFGVLSSPKNCVVRATLYAYDDEMADGIEAALQNLTDGNNKLTGKGFVPYKSGTTKKDFYKKQI